jgi:dienelactone hydrolase
VCVLVVASLLLASGSSPAAVRQDIAIRVVRYVDQTRIAHYRNGRSGPRTLVTSVRYPALAHSPMPLVVFGHGFASTPAEYARLLDAWSRAGYVVAAPLFPVENAHAPGGPDENDLINQPSDMSFVISRLLAATASATSPLYGRIDPTRIAVAGQSDGGETALAVAYDGRFADRRVGAAVILSGAELGGRTSWFGAGSPPLLAVQGTSDRINPPRYTRQFFRTAPRPKFLLSLIGAGHLPPYTTDLKRLAVVERVTIAFLDRFLKGGSLRQLLEAGHAADARLTSDP